MLKLSSRELALLALDSFFSKGIFVDDFLKTQVEKTTKEESNFAKHLSLGVLKNAIAFEKYLCCLNQGKSRLKRIEKLLFFVGIYQILFMDSIPKYAAVNETINLAKKYTHFSFIKKLNAILRKVEPVDYGVFLKQLDLSSYYSLSQDLVHEFLSFLNRSECKILFETFQHEKVTFFRLIKGCHDSDLYDISDDVEEFEKPFYKIKNAKLMGKLGKSSSIYFQNPTPYRLFHFLKEKKASDILDLCSAPGGKLLLAHENFPKAKLFANDISQKRLALVYENLEKYHIKAHVTCFSALDYPKGEFDIVILDAPCSNTGVLRKKPEAKLTFSKKKLNELVNLQKELIKKAVSLVKDNGELWYMTCSLLPKENKHIVDFAIENYPVRLVRHQTIMPTPEGLDGGFAALFVKQSDR